MATTQAKMSDKVKDSIEHAQARLTTFEEEAQKVVSDLLSKGKASRKIFTKRLKLGTHDLEASVKEIPARAKHVGDELTGKLEEIFERVIAFAGVASREEVKDLQKDLDRLSRKLDKIISGSTAKAKKTRARA